MALTKEQKTPCKREKCNHGRAAHKDGGNCRMKHCTCPGFKGGGLFG